MARNKQALFDPECYALANYFLEGEMVQEAVSACQAEADRRSLSEAIQSAVDDWLFLHSVASRREGPARGGDAAGA
jgi:hypothetical protein